MFWHACTEFSVEFPEGRLREVHAKGNRCGNEFCISVGVEGDLRQSKDAAVLIFVVGFLAHLGGAFDVPDAVVFWVLPDKPSLEFVSKHFPRTAPREDHSKPDDIAFADVGDLLN